MSSKDKGTLTDAAVKKATGKTWEQWKQVFTKAKAQKLPHKDLMQIVKKQGVKDVRWTQMVASTYEKMRGSAATDEMVFRTSVQKMFVAGSPRVWEVMMDAPGRTIWFGTLKHFPTKEGEQFATEEGMQGELTAIAPMKSIRMQVQVKGAKARTALVVQFTQNHGKTGVRIEHEGLRNKKEREEMRRYWQSALDRLGPLFIV